MRKARENPAFKEAWRSYEGFIERFPSRLRPEKIEKLAAEGVYNPSANKLSTTSTSLNHFCNWAFISLYFSSCYVLWSLIAYINWIVF